MPQHISVGIVGAKFAAGFHFEAYRRLYGLPVDVVGVCSASIASAEAFALERGLRAYKGMEDLCADCDVVDICSPGSTHETLAVEALRRGKHVIIEKPFTGYYGPGTDNFRGNTHSKETMLREAVASCDRILAAARESGKKICYAENWVYAPAVQKEREILLKSAGQILWIIGNQSHSGSHSPYYGIWKFSGGGSLLGKGCHPLTAVLYLKRVEGDARQNVPIRPVSVSARTHEITRLKGFHDLGFLRTSYSDIEDYGSAHVTFSDGTVADIFSSELVLGGVYNWLEIFANNHRTRCNLNPIDALETYNAREDYLKDVYVTEKIGTKQGWSHPAPDEDWQHGYPQEIQDFMEAIAADREPLCGAELGRDTVAVIYAGYLSAERRGAEVKVPL